MEHLTIEDILAYAADTLPQKDIFRVEVHLAECEECARRVDDHVVIRERFDEVWNSWTVKKHAQEVFQARLLEALEQADVPIRLTESAVRTSAI